MKLSELFYTKDKYRPNEREIHTPDSSLPTDAIKAEIKKLSDDDRLGLKDILDLIMRKFGPDGHSWAKRHLVAALSESEWITPKKEAALKKLKIIMSKPREAEEMKQLLRGILSSPELDQLLSQEGDANEIVAEYIHQHHPDLDRVLKIRSEMSVDEFQGFFSPLGHEYEDEELDSQRF